MQVEDFKKAQKAMENIKRVQSVLTAANYCHYIKFGPEAAIGHDGCDVAGILLDLLFQEIKTVATDKIRKLLEVLNNDFQNDGFLSDLDPDYAERLYNAYNSLTGDKDLGKRYVEGHTVFVKTDTGVFVETVADSHINAQYLASLLNECQSSIFHTWDEVTERCPDTVNIRTDLINKCVKWVPLYGTHPGVMYKDGMFDCDSCEEAFELASALNQMREVSLEEWDIILGWLIVNKPTLVEKYKYR